MTARIEPHPKKQAFLAAYSETGNVREAARAAGIDRGTHYDWLRKDPEYVTAFAHAQEDAADTLEAVARNRAIQGSDLLTIFLLKGLRPERYRERYNVTGEMQHAHTWADMIREVDRVATDGSDAKTLDA